MDSTSFTRRIAYVAASIGTLVLVIGLIVTSWIYAAPAGGRAASRLRWHMVTKNKIARGTQIKPDDVTWTLGRVSATDPLIPISKTVVGKYAKNDIDANSTCLPELLSDLALAEPPQGGVTVPIEVQTSDVSGLKPGLHLAFVQEGKEVQPKTTLLNQQSHPGLLLLSMTASTKDPADTTLFVEVGKDDLESVPLLVNGTWRPVILGAVEPAPQQTPLAHPRAQQRPLRRRR